MADLLPPLTAAQVDAKTKVDEKVDYSNLPSPVPYEELHREAFSLVYPKPISRSIFFLISSFFSLHSNLLNSWIFQSASFLICVSNECGF